MWLRCVFGLSLRAAMSSIIRRRSGLTVLVSLMGSSILSEVDNTLDLRMGLPFDRSSRVRERGPHHIPKVLPSGIGQGAFPQGGRMRRRGFITLIGGAAVTRVIRAGAVRAGTSKPPIIAIVAFVPVSKVVEPYVGFLSQFPQGLQELGYV